MKNMHELQFNEHCARVMKYAFFNRGGQVYLSRSRTVYDPYFGMNLLVEVFNAVCDKQSKGSLMSLTIISEAHQKPDIRQAMIDYIVSTVQ